MNRREALTSLAALAGAVGISVTPVTTTEATDATMVFLKADRRLSMAERDNLTRLWIAACEGTALERVKAIVLDSGLEVEIVRSRIGAKS